MYTKKKTDIKTKIVRFIFLCCLLSGLTTVIASGEEGSEVVVVAGVESSDTVIAADVQVAPAVPEPAPAVETKKAEPVAVPETTQSIIAEAQLQGAGEPIQSIAFVKDMSIRDALRLLAARYSKNIVPSSEVDGQLAFTSLKDVSFEEALNAILGGKFEYEVKGTLIEVFRKGDKTRMKHAVFALHYISAAEAATLIRPILSSDGQVGVTSPAQTGVPTGESISAPVGGGDTMSLKDTIVVYDYTENIKRSEELIKAIDVRPQQVLVEATILSATLTEDTQFGIDWDTLKGDVITNISQIDSGSPDFLRSNGTQFGGATKVAGGLTVGLAIGDVGVFLRAVEQVSDVTLLANPKILAVNKQLGQVYIGEKVGYREGDIETEGGGIQEGAVRFLDTGTKLSFRPYISEGGHIRMDIHTKDSTDQSSGGIPSENSAELVTNIMVKDGETIVIGGLFRDRVESRKSQIPILGDLPLVGFLFRGESDDKVRQEVIVLLTPHIVDAPAATDGELRADDVSRKVEGAKDGMQEIGRSRIAEGHYADAVEYYYGKQYDLAMCELDKALRLRPTYLEAIQLKERILNETGIAHLEREAIEKIEQPENKMWRRR